MTYNFFESSPQSGQPVFKFLFSVGDVEYRYTNADHIIGDSSGSFIPEAISLDEDFVNSMEFSNSVVPVVLPRTNELAQLFIGGVPDQITNLTIWRGHTTDIDDEFLVFWQGRIVGVSVDIDELKLECESIFSSMKRNGLHRRYQIPCPYSIYGQGCFVDKYLFEVNLLVTSSTGTVWTVDGADAYPDNYFRGGHLTLPNGVERYIVSHIGDVITLIRPVANIDDVFGSDLEIDSNTVFDSSGSVLTSFYPGCNHTSDCKNIFDNRLNYGGFPYQPDKNPFLNVDMY